MCDRRPLFGAMSVSNVVHRETNGRLAMMLRIIHGKLKPGTWESYERAYKEVTAKAGKIPGLKGRWLAHAVDDPDAGYTMSLWADEAAMRSYENGEILQTTHKLSLRICGAVQTHLHERKGVVRSALWPM